MENTILIDALNRINGVLKAQEVNFDVHTKMQEDIETIKKFILEKEKGLIN